MSRIADALARAGAGHAGTPAATRIEVPDTFPAELKLREPAPSMRRVEAPVVHAPDLPNAVATAPGAPRVEPQRWAGVVPAGRKKGLNVRRDLAEKLAIENGASQTVVEEFRKLAATLHHAQGTRRLKIIMVTSAAGREGKTLTSVNLSLTLSESYRRRVLLVDADLRKPTVHDIFQLENTAGLLTLLKSGMDRPMPVTAMTPLLTVMPSGGVTPDPIGVLTSAAVQDMLRDAAEVFDWVVVDTPPAALLPDSSLLAPAVDGVLLVVDAFGTPYPMAQGALDAVGRDKVLGVVLNHAEHSASSYSSGYY